MSVPPSRTPASDIAIIGLSCVFPGAGDARRYWQNILDKVDSVSDAPSDWEAERFFDAESGANDRTYCKRGGFLGDLAAFDPSLYGVMPNAVDGAEPDHFLALRNASDALRDAGYSDIGKFRERTEVVIGRGTYVNRGNATAMQHSMVLDSVLGVLRQLHPEYTDDELGTIRTALKASLPPFHADTAPGLVPNIISGRIANRLDLMGANYIVDAACASSLVAVDLAVRDLQSGRCDMALAGGVNASVPPVIMIIFSQLNALAKNGQIRPFDAEATGTLLGEGGGMVVLKRLEDAERDNDKIYAVLKGVGVASDGRAKGLLAPRLEGELLALERAYEAAGVDPSTVGLIEAHGTATLVGDATEMEALSKVFGETRGNARCALGSVKSMISHTMPASGIAGLIKVALSLHHKVLPPTLHCETPNPKLHLEKSNFYLNSETRPWIHDVSIGPRRAGVNAFGFGGINAHAVVEEYTGPSRAPWMQHEWDAECFIVSAESDERLPAAVASVIGTLERLPADTPLRNIAFTLNCERAHGPARLGVVATNRQELIDRLNRASPKLQDSRTKRIRDVEGIYFNREPLGGAGRLALMFPGEGAQYAGMLSDLCIHFPEVRHWFDFMNEAFANRGYRLSDSVFPPPGVAAEARLFSMDVGAEAVFCGNQAVHALLSHLGIEPHAVVGHSTGEHSALLASGIVRTDTKDSLLHHVRGVNRVFEDLQNAAAIQTGVLLAVAGVAPATLESLVNNSSGTVFMALDNCPNQAVLFGSEESIRKTREALATTSAICQELPFGRAYHTPLFAPFAERLREHFESVTVAAPRIATYSCVTSEQFPTDPKQIRELASVQWSSAVRFRETIEHMHRDGIRLFIESGPRSGLTGFVGDILRRKQHSCVPANVQHRTGIHQLQHLVAELVAHHVPVALERLYERRHPDSIALAKAPSRPLLSIKMGLQPVRLPADFKPLKTQAASAQTLATAPVAAPEPSKPAASASTPAAVALAAHMQTMSQFLDTQQRVLNSYFASRRGTTAASASPAPARPALPFMSDVRELIDGVKARALVRLSPADQPLLADHTLGRNVSIDDPALLGLPVFPLTFTMEVLAEAGALLAPGRKLVGMRDVRASRWVALERGEIVLDVTAEQTAEAGSVQVRVREFSDGAPRPVCAEGLMLFADNYPPQPAPLAARLTDRKPSEWAPERLYAEGMFHGSSLRAVHSVNETASNGTSATIEVLPRNTLVKGHPEPGFLTDPVVLDATGQVVAFWTQEVLQKAGDIFPYRLGALHCYGPLRAPGTLLRCDVVATRVTDKDLASDIEVRDTQGIVLYRLESWEDRRFLLPRNLWDLRLSPRTTRTGVAWMDPIRHLTGNPVSCARVDLAPELLDASHGIWMQSIAHSVLSRPERQEWRGMTGPAAQQWLAGRCAAKDAVRLLLKEAAGIDVCAADVEIHSGADDRLFARGRWVQRLGAAPSVSVSCTTGTAVAIAALTQDHLVGVGVRHLAELTKERVTEALSASERRVLHDSAGSAADEWYARAFCAKQSLKNALGNTVLHNPSDGPVVTDLRLENGTIEMEITNGALDRFPQFRGKRIRAQTVRDRDLVCSTTFLERVSTPPGGAL